MKIKRKLIKGVSGVLSTSILTASCTQYLPPEAYVCTIIKHLMIPIWVEL